MKPSEKLKQEAAAEDNDLKALGTYTKVLREERVERFEEHWLPKFQERYKEKFFYVESQGCYRLLVGEQNNQVDYYPKANKVWEKKLRNTRGQGWIKPGLKYLINTYFKDADTSKKAEEGKEKV